MQSVKFYVVVPMGQETIVVWKDDNRARNFWFEVHNKISSRLLTTLSDLGDPEFVSERWSQGSDDDAFVFLKMYYFPETDLDDLSTDQLQDLNYSFKEVRHGYQCLRFVRVVFSE